MMQNIVIGIVGGSGSGKSSVAIELQKYFGEKQAIVISQDSFYNDHSHLTRKEKDLYNFDSAEALDLPFYVKSLRELKTGNQIQIPNYDFVNSVRLSHTSLVYPKKFIIAEGLFLLTDLDLQMELNYSFFIDVSEETRLKRLVYRDSHERGKSYDEVVERCTRIVFPMHEKHIEPYKFKATNILKGEMSLSTIVEKIIWQIDINS